MVKIGVRCFLIDDWINKMCCVYIKWFYLVIMKNKVFLFFEKLDIIRDYYIKKIKKDNMFFFICGF